jgi:hypothetical protein
VHHQWQTSRFPDEAQRLDGGSVIIVKLDQPRFRSLARGILHPFQYFNFCEQLQKAACLPAFHVAAR